MKHLKSWSTYFNIPQDQLEVWRGEVPLGSSLIYWVLSEKKISVDAYMNWARDYLGIPSLSDNFSQMKLDLKLWKRVQGLPQWSFELVPLAEWDGVVFVACVDANLEESFDFPVQYILGTPDQLDFFWNKLNEIPMEGNEEEIFSGDDFSRDQIASLGDTEEKDVDSLGSSLITHSEIISAPPPLSFEEERSLWTFTDIDGVEGDEGKTDRHSISGKTSSPPFHNKYRRRAEDRDPNFVPKIPNSAPPFFRRSGDPKVEDRVDSEQVDDPQLQKEFSDQELSKDLESLDLNEFSESSGAEGSGAESSGAEGSLGADPVEDISEVSRDSFIASSHIKVEDKEDQSQGQWEELSSIVSDTEIDDGNERTFSFDTEVTQKKVIGLKLEDLGDGELEPIWTELKDYFNQSLIMKFDEDGDFYIWKIDSHWKGEKNFADILFSLNDPSSFKVVVRSSLPFHGLVSASPVNEKFIATCGLEIPRHVTIVPLFNDSTLEKLVGFLVGIGGESSQNLESLKVAEECGRKVSHILNLHFLELESA